MSDPLFGPEVRLMLQDGNTAMMKAFCETLHPATIADALADDAFSVEEVWKVLQQAGSYREQAAIFEYFPIDWQVALANGTGRPHMARLVEQMSHDDRVTLLRNLSPQATEALLRLVDEADRRDIAALSNFAEGSVGALLTTDYAWIPAGLTASEAIERLRQQAPDKETIYYIYVLEDDRRLRGVVSLRDLILAGRDTPVTDLMERDIVSLKATDNQEQAAAALARYDFLALPVVDDEGRLVGIVTHDDVIDVIREEATEDLQRQAGMEPVDENYLAAPFGVVWYRRVVWLAVLFLAEQFTFNAMAFFEDSIKTVAVLALFVPLCLSVGGNSGSQAATLITRALALGHVTLRDWFRVIRHELLMGLALGAALGTLGLLRTYFLTFDSSLQNANHTFTSRGELTLVIGLSVTAICLWGTLVGSVLPMAFKRMGFDPAMSSSPFIATFCDMTGIIIFFSVARFLLSALRGGG
jgi:magnesium transporter